MVEHNIDQSTGVAILCGRMYEERLQSLQISIFDFRL
ncbi:hypothetical protein GCK32_021602, partial [Trichostrongylus colubriformis]